MRNRSEDQITLVLIRHGATQGNREHRYLGRTDEPLCEAGEQELLEYRRAQCYPAVECLFTSPMKRCIGTAELLYPDMCPVIIPEWTEMDFGAFEGKNYRELQKDAGYQEWIDSNGILPFPGGESREAFIRRCDRGLHRMLQELRQPEYSRVKTVGMILHGGTIMALLSRYGPGDYFDYQAANGRGYVSTWNIRNAEPELTNLKELQQAHGAKKL